MNNDDFTDEELKILAEMDRDELASQGLERNQKIAEYEKLKPCFCPLCKKGFDKPKYYSSISLLTEIGVFVCSIFVGAFFFGIFGIVCAFILMFIISITKRCTSYKCCPHCGSKNFLKK